ncbi:hypothetical protein C2E23DRAFT_848889 [Lenzites betulinus]|nr:hypothetical protein C2E23DRAFT_848889 [Lenzites betulinus]
MVDVRMQVDSLSELDYQFSKKARKLALLSDEGDDSDQFWSDDSVDSGVTAVESSPYDVSKYEANLYYAGVGPNGRGPKLVYRTSDDVFEEPSGPEVYVRLMRIVAVLDEHELGRNGMWDAVRDQVVVLLNQRNIKVTTVDFVRFTWLNKHADQEIEDVDDEDDRDEDDANEEEELNYDDIPLVKPVEDGIRHYTKPTIWIGVLSDTLTGAVAHESSKDIRALLDSLQIQKIDIAYRESVHKTCRSHGPALLLPVEDGDPLKDFIDNVSVPLSLPIAGRKTTTQGTLGPYFRVGNKLYAITVRHNLFRINEDNDVYRYHRSGPGKKKVLLMGSLAFAKYIASIQSLISVDVDSVEDFEKQISVLRARVKGGINVEESQTKLDEKEAQLAKLRAKIEYLQRFFIEIKKRWSKAIEDRVIGFVCWAPPISVGVAPHRYTRDLCVIELYKDKFRQMIGNVLSLGPELSPAKLKDLMHDRIGVPSEFKYPVNGLLPLRGMLTADQANNPNSLDLEGDRIRRVIKRGLTTNTTVGTLSRFMSYARRYFPLGILESLEVPIFSHEHDTGTFSKGGDSGSLIVSARGEFVALLTGGTGTSKGTAGSDITFATPFDYVWDLVKEEFPGASLYFDNLEEFIAA